MLLIKNDAVIILAKLFKVNEPNVNHSHGILTILSSVVVPHITDAVQEWVERVARISVDNDPTEPDICIIEVNE